MPSALKKDDNWIDSKRIPSAVFVPAVALQAKFSFSANCREILGVCQTCLRMFCRLWESVWPGPSGKVLGSIAGVRCWRSSVTGCSEVCVLFGGVKSQPSTVCVGVWQRQGCVLSPLLFIAFGQTDTAESTRLSRWKLQDQPFSFCARFGASCILWTGFSTCTCSVCSWVRPSGNENYHWKERGIMYLQKHKAVYSASKWQCTAVGWEV